MSGANAVLAKATEVEELTDFLIGMVNEHCKINDDMLWPGRGRRVTNRVFDLLHQEGYLEVVPDRPELFRWTEKVYGS